MVMWPCWTSPAASPSTWRATAASSSRGDGAGPRKATTAMPAALAAAAASPLDDTAEVALHVGGEIAGLVQQGHITIGHALCGWVERELAGARAGDVKRPGPLRP